MPNKALELDAGPLWLTSFDSVFTWFPFRWARQARPGAAQLWTLGVIKRMPTTRTYQSLIITLLLCVIAGASYGGESKPWVTLTNCECVAAKYNDGDSFRVRSGTNEFTLRLYYVDAPETTMSYPERVHQQSEHYGITMDETLKVGAQAKERVQELLREPFIVRTRWASAAGRGRETRYYGFVEVGGKSLAEVLVSEGLAQAKGVAPNLPDGEKASAYMQKLEGLEQAARQKRLGAWATTQEKNVK